MNFDQHRNSVEQILQRDGRDYQRQGIAAMSTECLQFFLEHVSDPQFEIRINQRPEMVSEIKTLLKIRKHEEMKVAAASNDPYSKKTYRVALATLIATGLAILIGAKLSDLIFGK